MELAKEELELMIHHLTQEVVRLSVDKALLRTKLELAQTKGQG